MRRGLLVLGLGCALSVLMAACRDEPDDGGGTGLGPPDLSRPLFLPAPTGLHPVGKIDAALVDRSRGGLFPGEPADRRELVVHVWYPSEPQPGAATALYMAPPSFAAHGLPPEAVLLIQTNAVAGAPLSAAWATYPVVLLSHGLVGNVEFFTMLAEDLASHGYVVVGIDHTFMPAVTTFPDGRVVPIENDLLLGMGTPEPGFFEQGRELAINVTSSALLLAYEWVMADDVSFVIDELERWNAGALEGRFTGRLDLERIGLTGHAMGAGSTVLALGRDPRIDAGVALAGAPENGPPRPLARPLMLMTPPGQLEEDSGVARTWVRLTGPGYLVEVAGTGINAFSDASLLITHFFGREAAAGQPTLGTIEPLRIIELTRAYVLALFEQHLRGVPSPLLEGPSPAYPEVELSRR